MVKGKIQSGIGIPPRSSLVLLVFLFPRDLVNNVFFVS